MFLDETRPQTVAKMRSPWVLVDIFGERDGVPMPWDGAIAYNPAAHVEHYCVRDRKRISNMLRRLGEDL